MDQLVQRGFRVGPVHLRVADVDRSIGFYGSLLGLSPRPWTGVSTALVVEEADEPLIVLHERSGVRPARQRGRLGLYHVAVRLPTRADLAAWFVHVARLGVPVGAADHHVSEAIYLADPDGHGIEVYADRPASLWIHAGDEVSMTADPLDTAGLVAAAVHSTWSGAPSGTTIGHVHFHVPDLAAAERWYVDTVGLSVTMRSYPSARFFAVDGYHHHVGSNVWAGPSATPPGEDEAALLAWTWWTPDHAAVGASFDAARRAGVACDVLDRRDPRHPNPIGGVDAVVLTEPWGTSIVVAGVGPGAAKVRP